MLLMLSFLSRLLFWLIYDPVYFADSPHYFRLAENIRQLDFANYEGIRTPIYPLLLLLGGLNWHGIWLWQSLLGIASGYLLFALVRQATGSARLALGAGLLPSLQFNLLFAEANLLTESLAMFWLLLALYVWQSAQHSQRGLRLWLLLGCISALAGLTRPLLLLFGPLIVSRELFSGSPSGSDRGCIALLSFSWRLEPVQLVPTRLLRPHDPNRLQSHPSRGFLY